MLGPMVGTSLRIGDALASCRFTSEEEKMRGLGWCSTHSGTCGVPFVIRLGLDAPSVRPAFGCPCMGFGGRQSGVSELGGIVGGCVVVLFEPLPGALPKAIYFSSSSSST